MIDLLNKSRQNPGESLVINESVLADVLQALKTGNIFFDDGINYKDKDINDIKDLCAVHVSSIAPYDDKIVTKETSHKTNNMIFVDPESGIEHVVPYLVGDDTIHFTLNCVVANHEYGNDWNNYKYGVLVDFNKLDKSKILDVKSEDTYIQGDAIFESEYYLFCPLGEKEMLAQNNPKAKIVEYHGVSLNEAISIMIVLSGKKLQPYGTYGWGRNHEYGQDSKDIDKLEELVTKQGYPVLKGTFGNMLHSESKYMAQRMWKREYEALISLLKYNMEHGIDMPNNIVYMVMVYGGAYGLPGTVPVSIEEYKRVVIPILNKYGYDVDDALFDGLQIDDNIKYIYDSGNPSGEPTVICPLWENELRKRVISLIRGNVKKHNGV